MPYPAEPVPDEATARALAARDPAALAWWRGVQQRAYDDPALVHEADYTVETRSVLPPGFSDWHVCPGCGLSKAFDPSERICNPCAQRGAAPQRGGRAGGTLTGAQALSQMTARGRTMRGADAVDHMDRLDELERRSRDVELLDAYESALGVSVSGVDHRPGRRS